MSIGAAGGERPEPARGSGSSLAERIDALLPQTQCTRCGYPACRPYAEALAAGEAAHNRCPPGGESTIRQLAGMLGTKPLPLDPACGEERPRVLAVIDEAWCIGCTLCIQACPVDAIIGAAKRLHAVVGPWCTGCELCVAPCPVDCIRLVPDPGGPRSPAVWLVQRAAGARERYRVHRERLSAERPRRRTVDSGLEDLPPTVERRRAVVQDAVERFRDRVKRPAPGADR